MFFYFEFRVKPVPMQIRIDHLPAICTNHKSLDTIVKKGSIKYQANSSPTVLLFDFFIILIAWFSLRFGLKQADCFVLRFLYSHICLVRFKLLTYNWNIFAFLKEQNSCVRRSFFEKLDRITDVCTLIDDKNEPIRAWEIWQLLQNTSAAVRSFNNLSPRWGT